MIVTEVVPRSGRSEDVSAASGIEWLREVYRPSETAFVRLNMITSLTGSAAGADGTSETLTSRVDRAILGVIRAAADVIVVGAESVRAEGYVVPRRARLAVVTASGDLEGSRLTLPPDSPADRVMVICPASRSAALRALVPPGMLVVPVPGGQRLDPYAILTALADRGLSRVVCEGGPSLASQFAMAGAIDEYCVTSAPVIGPVDSPFLRVDARLDVELAGALVDEAGFSYLRLRSRR